MDTLRKDTCITVSARLWVVDALAMRRITVIRKRLLNWLGGVDLNDYKVQMQAVLDINQDLIKNNTLQRKAIEALKTWTVLGLNRQEQVIKYGCHECWALGDEWHLNTCSQAGTLVERRNSGSRERSTN